MSDKIDEAIQLVAVKHSVLLGKDDPILILQTMNERLIEESRRAQQEMLAQFREEMESISSQWKVDATEKAEKVLNAALVSGKEAMNKILSEAANESGHAIKKLVSDLLTQAKNLSQETCKTNRFTLLSSAAMLTVTCVFMLLVLVNSLK